MKNKNLTQLLENYIEGNEKVIEIEEAPKPFRYWKEWENVEKELKIVVEKLGHFPVQRELKPSYQSLLSSIHKYHGGMHEVAKIMGYELNRRINGYWTKKNTIKECKKLVSKYGELPSQNKLKELGLSSIAAAINKYGGFIVVRKELNIGGGENYSKGYWNDEENAIKEYRRIAEELGKPPSNTELIQLKMGGLADAIQKKHEGFQKFKEKSGFKSERNLYGYWTLEKVLEYSQEIVDDKGYLPPLSELKEYDGKYKGLVSAISRIGIEKIRQKLDVKGMENPAKNKPDGYWTKENTFNEAKKLVEELGYLPTGKELYETDRSSLTGPITKYFGFSGLRKKLGLKLKRVENNSWNENKILKECKKILREYGGLPSNKKLNKIGYGALATQIIRNGGYFYFREKLGLDELIKSKGYWESWDNVNRELKEIIKKIGHFPTQKELEKIRKGSLSNSIIKNFGGFSIVREKFGYSIIKRPDGYWNKENTYNEALDLSRKLGYFPSYHDLRENHLTIINDLSKKYFSGIRNLRELIEQKLGISEDNKLESLLENYTR